MHYSLRRCLSADMVDRDVECGERPTRLPTGQRIFGPALQVPCARFPSWPVWRSAVLSDPQRWSALSHSANRRVKEVMYREDNRQGGTRIEFREGIC